MTSERLNRERDILNKYFRGMFQFYNINLPGEYLEMRLKTQSGNSYVLKIEIEPDYPSSMPSVFVTYPGTLVDFYGSKMLLASGPMHTLNGKGGFTKICHTWSANWNPNRTLFQVVMKARLWLEAYEGHKRTGNLMDHYLNEN